MAKAKKAKLVEDASPAALAEAKKLIPEFAFVTGTKAKAYAIEFQRIKDEFGQLTPELIVDEAMKPESPLHDWPGWKGWDKSAASMAYWVGAARRLVGEVKIRIIKDPRADRAPVRALVTVIRNDGARDIEGLLNALQNDDYKEQLIRREMNVIKGAKLRLRDFSEFLPLIEQLDQVLDMGGKMADQMSKKKKVKKAS